MLLSDIDWGQDSAEHDPHLLRYFYDSAAFRRISRRQKQLVVGRKGAGKSALRAKLKMHFESEANTFVITVVPQYSTIRSILNEQDLQTSFGQEVFFQHTWLRQILIDCLVAVGQSVKGKIATDSHAFARDIANELRRTSKDLVENVFEVLTKVRAKVGELGEFGAHLERELKAVSEVESLEHHLVTIAATGAKFVILIDDLDQGWDNSKTANQFLLGLLLAASYLQGRQLNIFPVIFLREDVYNILMKETMHADKYRNIESIRWETDQLIEVLTSRIRFNREQSGAPELEEPFQSVFPDKVGTSYTVTWMTERTLNRPRELIQLARSYTDTVDTDSPSDQALKSAELSYSRWKLQDICSEFSNQYPGLNTFFDTWRARFARNSYQYRRAELEDVLMTLLAEAAVNADWFNKISEETDTQRLIEILYEIGVLGDYAVGGAAGGTRVHYSYELPHEPRFEILQVHPCFRRALDTRERRSGS